MPMSTVSGSRPDGAITTWSAIGAGAAMPAARDLNPGTLGNWVNRDPRTWLATASPAGLVRCGTYHDGWLPYTPTPEEYRDGLEQVRVAAEEAGRAPSTITPGLYVTSVSTPIAAPTTGFPRM